MAGKELVCRCNYRRGVTTYAPPMPGVSHLTVSIESQNYPRRHSSSP
jgi:hypothetical protein